MNRAEDKTAAPGITDFHVHAFPDELASRAMDSLLQTVPAHVTPTSDGTVSGLLRSMDRAGIRRSVLCSIATSPKQVPSILSWSLKVRSERIVPLGSVHPDCEDPPGEVRRTAQSGLLGIKLHPMYQGFAVDEERLWPLYAAAEQSGLMLMLHAGRDMSFPADDDRADPRRILKLHRAFPDLTLVAAHMGGWRQWREVAQVLAGTNVYLETSFSLDQCAPDQMRDILARHSIERILFGSDSPWQGQAETIALVRRTWPRTTDQQKVLAGNAERLLTAAACRLTGGPPTGAQGSGH